MLIAKVEKSLEVSQYVFGGLPTLNVVSPE